jgi:hypothetical protein
VAFDARAARGRPGTARTAQVVRTTACAPAGWGAACLTHWIGATGAAAGLRHLGLAVGVGDRSGGWTGGWWGWWP